jgi:sugar transferase (PEP-CTERM/EpsH1 system associated)
LSRDLEHYLERAIGVPPERIEQIYNGVDADRFAPPPSGIPPAIPGCPFARPGHWLVGTVGRLQHVKDQVTLARAFVRIVQRDRATAARARLVIVGDGPLLPEVEQLLAAAGLRDCAWLPGGRADIPDILRGLDCFVLPSLAEGISNTILEAMACGVPVIATRVGGNPELIEDRMTGRLVPATDPDAIAAAALGYLDDPATARRHARAARTAVVQRFSLDRMVKDYLALYDELLRRSAPTLSHGGAAVGAARSRPAGGTR